MSDSSFFIFKFNEFVFGIDVAFIQEILEIPELEQPPEASLQFVSFLNLGGEVIEILDLAPLLDLPKKPHSINDFIVILKGDSFFFGLIVQGTVNIDRLPHVTEISEAQQFSFLSSHVAHVHDQLIFILKPNLLIKKLDCLIEHIPSSISQKMEPEYPINEEARNILTLRAHHLKHPIKEEKNEKQIPLMIVVLEQNYFGIDPEDVREFIPLKEFNPIPQSPPYLLGCLSFKGSVLTLLDIWPILKMQKLKVVPDSQALILNPSTAGIIVDKVVDLIYIPSTALQAVPIRLEGTPFQAFTKYVVTYEEKILNVLDIPKILESVFNSGDEHVRILKSPQN